MPCVKRATSAWIAKCPVSVRLAPGTKGPRLFLDDTRLEFEHRVANVARKFPVAFAMAHDQQKILPPLRNEVLDERVGKHCPARQQMQKVGAAILAAQPVVLSPSRGGGRSGDLATLPLEKKLSTDDRGRKTPMKPAQVRLSDFSLGRAISRSTV